ncbi:MAG: type II toxin-antitoxin system VapC family toxin [Methanosarcinales archaeon Met12]|nr:MAG: type II toxin-antitoxin system VapC family toxin [Methanosarcinales archaeon Met12]
MIFVDSNIFMFAGDENYPEHMNAKSFFEEKREKFCFNTIIALESHYGYLRNLGAEEAEVRLKAMLESKLLKYYAITEEDLIKGAEISRRYNIKTNDATIIANMLRNGIDRIATDNVKDFSKHSKIKVINPIKRFT